MVDETITEFSRFLEDVNPSDFQCASTPAARAEMLSITENAGDMADALAVIQAFLSQGETGEISVQQVLSVALPLARNNHVGSAASKALMELFEKGLTEVGLTLAGNFGLTPGQYLFLARMDDASLRVRLAENPCVGPDVIEVLLEDENEAVIHQALNNRHCSQAMTVAVDDDILQGWSQIKALDITNILRARTAADFNKCAAPHFDARLLEAYVINPYSPEELIVEISAYPTVAGQLATLHLNEMYYKFQK